MSDLAIIIPSRLNAVRLPNKPLKKIHHKEMIVHVYDAAKKTGIKDVIVATPDDEIINLIKRNNGKAVKTDIGHKTGTDRIFEVFEKILSKKPKIIINLQGDMPNINPKDINFLIEHMITEQCDIGTLASLIDEHKDFEDQNVVKVLTKKEIKIGEFCEAKDFLRKISNHLDKKIYHHIGIYAFTNKALLRYVSLKRSKHETERNLEQMRALDNKMKIHVGLVDTPPLSVDTEEDLEQIKKILR